MLSQHKLAQYNKKPMIGCKGTAFISPVQAKSTFSLDNICYLQI